MQAANTGSSTNANSYAAGKEAAAKAKAGLSNVKLAFAYASVENDLGQVLDGIKSEMPGVPVIGNTSFTGVIMPEGYISGETGFVGIMALSDEELTVGVAAFPKDGNARDTGRAVAKKALQSAGKTASPDYFYMVAPPGEEEFFLKGISDVIGRVPFFGGSAADNDISGKWKLYTDQGAFADGVAVAFFYTDKPIANYFTGAYRETGDMGIITKVEGNRKLVEIDGVPAVKKYAEWTGVAPDSLKGMALLGATITSPLGVKDRLGDLVAIRHPMNGNDDYSMNIGSNLTAGTAVIRMEATVDELIDSTSQAIKAVKQKLAAPVAALHLAHCGGRRAGIGDRIDEVTAHIQQEAGNIPFICEFTFGEYGYEDDGNNTCGGLMLSFTAFGK
ncbi:MAG: hypothetical protein HPY76_10745 [Anaerolineae bacterium]|nr:hypothetical protein [Anaerolineae bacterium]